MELDVRDLSSDDLMPAFRKAEEDGDDITCLKIIGEAMRRGLVVMDKD